jgi:hypothetical protein
MGAHLRDPLAHARYKSAAPYELICFARKRNFSAQLRQTGTTGKSVKSLSIPSRENIPLSFSPKSAA